MLRLERPLFLGNGKRSSARSSSNRSGDAHVAGRQADDKENVIADQTNSGPHFDSEEICGGHDLPVSPQKLVPRSRSATLRSRIESRALEDTGHRGSSDSLSEIFECALNAGM